MPPIVQNNLFSIFPFDNHRTCISWAELTWAATSCHGDALEFLTRMKFHSSHAKISPWSRTPAMVVQLLLFAHKPQCNSNKLGERESVTGRCREYRGKYESEQCGCWQQHIRQTRLHVTHCNLIWQVTEEQLHIQNIKHALLLFKPTKRERDWYPEQVSWSSGKSLKLLP